MATQEEEHEKAEKDAALLLVTNPQTQQVSVSKEREAQAKKSKEAQLGRDGSGGSSRAQP